MKLHGTRKLGSTSVPLNNIDKYVKREQSDPFDLEKGPLERFKQTRLLAVHLYSSWKAPCKNRERVTEQFLNIWYKYVTMCEKGQNLIVPTLKKDL